MVNTLSVLTFGEVLWDLLPSGKQMGGAPANFAYYAKELGADSNIISAVGKDELGKEIKSKLNSIGLDTSCIVENEYPTSTVDVVLSSNGIPSYLINDNVAWDMIPFAEKFKSKISEAKAFCWGSLAQRSIKTRNTLYEILINLPSNCKRVFDINLRQNFYTYEIISKSMYYADFLKLNEDELPVLMEMENLGGMSEKDAIKYLISRYDLNLVIYTKGADSSLVICSYGNISELKTPKIQVVDTVGAGDSFTAAFVTSYLNGSDITSSHKRAVEIASYVCGNHGAITSLPDFLK